MTVDTSKEGLWRAMQEHNAGRRTGRGAGGDFNDSGMSTKDYVDLKVGSVETKILARIDTLASKSTIWGAVATGTAIILAVLAFAGDRFDAGISSGDQRFQQQVRDDKQDQRMRSVDDKLEAILRSLERR